MGLCASDGSEPSAHSFNPQRILLIYKTFVPHCYPLTHFPPNDLVIRVDGRLGVASERFAQHGYVFRAPSGKGTVNRIAQGMRYQYPTIA
jgi:hypothetical protein